MPRTRRTAAVLCLALVLFAAFVPAMASALGTAVLVPLGLVLPGVAVTVLRRAAFRCDEQPVSLLALLESRAPPVSALA
jgi:hypothetical protein